MENEPKNPNFSPSPAAGPPEPEAGTIADQPSPPPVTPQPNEISRQMDSLLADAATDEQRKKRRKKLIRIFLYVIISAILIGGAAFGALWYINRQKPENVVLNAVVKTINQKAYRVTGDFAIHGEAMEESGIRSISIRSNDKSSILPTSSETTITIITTDEDEFEIKTNEIYLADGVLYFRVDGLTETIEAVMQKVMAEMTAGMDYIYDEMLPSINYFSDILADIEGTWWRFDIADFGMPEEITAQYDCVIGTIGSINTSNTKDELTNLYRDWPLLDVTKTGDKKGDYEGYNVNLNAANTAGFLNNLRTTGFYQGFSKCMKSANESFEDYSNVSASDVALTGDRPTFTLYIHPWSHELRSISVNYGDSDVDMFGSLTLEFVDSVNISAPEESKPVMELVESVAIKVCDMFVVGSPYTAGGLSVEECLTSLMGSMMGISAAQEAWLSES